MKEKSLLLAAKEIVFTLQSLDIDPIDKAELMRNLSTFLDPKYYEESVQILSEALNDKIRYDNKWGTDSKEKKLK